MNHDNGKQGKDKFKIQTKIVFRFLLIFTVFNLLFFSDLKAYGKEWKEIKLPQDDGKHSPSGIEWWYFSGHLKSEDNLSYGFMGCFFKVEKTLVPTYFIAFALTDENNGIHYSHGMIDKNFAKIFKDMLEQQMRKKPDEPRIRNVLKILSDDYDKYVFKEKPIIKSGLMHVSFGKNYIKAVSDDTYQVHLEWDDIEYTLDMKRLKEPLLIGDNGVVKMAGGGYSYYYSYARLGVSGTLKIGGESKNVTGLGWFDHQWGDFNNRAYKGWDWFSIQLDNNEEYNLFIFRNEKNEWIYSSGTISRADNKRQVIEKIDIEVLEKWHSDKTDTDYPVKWKVTLPEVNTVFYIEATIPNQEMAIIENIRPIWEGSCKVSAIVNGIKVNGMGYAELTGYMPTSDIIEMLR